MARMGQICGIASGSASNCQEILQGSYVIPQLIQRARLSLQGLLQNDWCCSNSQVLPQCPEKKQLGGITMLSVMVSFFMTQLIDRTARETMFVLRRPFVAD
jgi:hypothetical protein